jgi:predicted ABC-type ATPase
MSPEKELIVVGGPNGAGKTSFIKGMLAQYSCPYLSADAIAAELSPANPTTARIAGEEFLRRFENQLEAIDSFIIESTLSGRTLLARLRRARALGFRLKLVFIFVDSADVCVARVEERVRAGGHDVPVADIRRRFGRSITNFWSLYRPVADHWALMYNSSNSFCDVAAGIADSVVLRDEILYRVFQDLARLASDE